MNLRAATLFLLALGCSGCGDDVCARAVAHYARCTGVELPVDPDCDTGAAEDFLLMDCDAVDGAFGKADTQGCPPGADCNKVQPVEIELARLASGAKPFALSKPPLDGLKIWLSEKPEDLPAELAIFAGGHDDATKVDADDLVIWARVQEDDWLFFWFGGVEYLLQVGDYNKRKGAEITIRSKSLLETEELEQLFDRDLHPPRADGRPTLARARLSEEGSALSFRYRGALHAIAIEDVKYHASVELRRRVVATIARCVESCIGETSEALAEAKLPPPLQFTLAQEQPRCPHEVCEAADEDHPFAALQVTYSAMDRWNLVAEQQATLSLHGPRGEICIGEACNEVCADDPPEEPGMCFEEDQCVDGPHECPEWVEPMDGEEDPADEQKPPASEKQPPTAKESPPETEPPEVTVGLTHRVEDQTATLTVEVCSEKASDLAGKAEVTVEPDGGEQQVKTAEITPPKDGKCAKAPVVFQLGPGEHEATAVFRIGKEAAGQSKAISFTVEKPEEGAPETAPAGEDTSEADKPPETDGKKSRKIPVKPKVWVEQIARERDGEEAVYTVEVCYEGELASPEYVIGLYLQKGEPKCKAEPDFDWTAKAGRTGKDCRAYSSKALDAVGMVWVRADISCETVDEIDRTDNLRPKTFGSSDSPDADDRGSSGGGTRNNAQRDDDGKRQEMALAGGGAGCRLIAVDDDPAPLLVLGLLAWLLRAGRRRRRR